VNLPEGQNKEVFSIRKKLKKKWRPSFLNKGRRNGKGHSSEFAISSSPTPCCHGNGKKYLKIKQQNKTNIHLRSLV